MQGVNAGRQAADGERGGTAGSEHYRPCRGEEGDEAGGPRHRPGELLEDGLGIE